MLLRSSLRGFPSWRRKSDMNKRDREQLRASIANDLVQGQGEHSPTRELLKQYAPLEGIVTPPVSGHSLRSRLPQPVENTMASRATVARGANNKEKLDDVFKRKSSSKGKNTAVTSEPVENHSGPVASRERKAATDDELSRVRSAFDTATATAGTIPNPKPITRTVSQRSRWEKTMSVLEAVARRTPPATRSSSRSSTCSWTSCARRARARRGAPGSRRGRRPRAPRPRRGARACAEPLRRDPRTRRRARGARARRSSRRRLLSSRLPRSRAWPRRARPGGLLRPRRAAEGAQGQDRGPGAIARMIWHPVR